MPAVEVALEPQQCFAAGEGTRNYVMFSDDMIDILRKYGLAGLMAGAGGAAAMPGQQSNQ